MPIALSFTVSGLLCLFAKEKAFYWCIWTFFAPLVIALPFLTEGLSDGAFVFSLTVGEVTVAVIMFFIAGSVFRDTVIETSAKKSLLLVLAWIVPIALFAFVFFHPYGSYAAFYRSQQREAHCYYRSCLLCFDGAP